MLRHCRRLDDLKVGIDLLRGGDERGRDPRRISCRTDDERKPGAALTLGIGLVNDVERSFTERSHVDVARHADDHQIGLARIRPAEDAAERVALRPVATGHRFTDDRHWLTVPPVAVVEVAARDDRHTGCFEESAVDFRALRAECLPARG